MNHWGSLTESRRPWGDLSTPHTCCDPYNDISPRPCRDIQATPHMKWKPLWYRGLSCSVIGPCPYQMHGRDQRASQPANLLLSRDLPNETLFWGDHLVLCITALDVNPNLGSLNSALFTLYIFRRIIFLGSEKGPPVRERARVSEALPEKGHVSQRARVSEALSEKGHVSQRAFQRKGTWLRGPSRERARASEALPEKGHVAQRPFHSAGLGGTSPRLYRRLPPQQPREGH